MFLEHVAALVIVAAAPAASSAQSASAPLLVTATVVRSCRVEVPRVSNPASLPTVPVALTCARTTRRAGAGARVQRPQPGRTETRDAVVVIDF